MTDLEIAVLSDDKLRDLVWDLTWDLSKYDPDAWELAWAEATRRNLPL